MLQLHINKDRDTLHSLILPSLSDIFVQFYVQRRKCQSAGRLASRFLRGIDR